MIAVALGPISQGEVDALRRRMHAGKRSYATHFAAHYAAESFRAHSGEHVAAYRCLFMAGLPDEEPHFHFGHPPTLAGLERIARWMRFGVQP